jgi:hypothetical protein
VLLAVIFRCENAPDSQTGFEPGISQNIRAVFSRISDILGVGNPSGEDSLRRRSGAGKRVGPLPVLWGILDPQNRCSFLFPILQPIQKDFRQPKGNNKAGFPPRKIGYFGFQARMPFIWKNVIKNAPIRPVTKNRLKNEYARIEP